MQLTEDLSTRDRQARAWRFLAYIGLAVSLIPLAVEVFTEADRFANAFREGHDSAIVADLREIDAVAARYAQLHSHLPTQAELLRELSPDVRDFATFRLISYRNRSFTIVSTQPAVSTLIDNRPRLSLRADTQPLEHGCEQHACRFLGWDDRYGVVGLTDLT